MSGSEVLGGWTGTVLRVDLTAGRVTQEALNQEWARSFVGGRGVAARYFDAEVDPLVDPFAPENKLIFATGPLTGTNCRCVFAEAPGSAPPFREGDRRWHRSYS